MNGFASAQRVFRIVPLVLGFATIATAQPTADLPGLQDRLATLFKENQPAMVRVKAIYPPQDDDDVPQVVIGSGFFISREGLILTNASIVYEPLRVWIEHDDIAYSAEVLGFDERANVAFLRTHTLPENFSFLHLADSAALPRVGTFVLRLSMPLEFSASPSFGIVAGYESRFGERFFPCTYVRTSIPAGPGDGGAAFFDLSGRLLGVQVGSLPEIGASYILPARAALRIRDDVLFSGTVTYGWIGFEVELKSSIDNGRQLVLSEVFPESPAEAAGLLEEDVLLRIGDYPIHVLDDLRNAMFYTRVGQYVEVEVLRGDQNRRFSVRIGARPENEPMQTIEPAEPAPPIEPLKKKEPSSDEDGDAPYLEELQGTSKDGGESVQPSGPGS